MLVNVMLIKTYITTGWSLHVSLAITLFSYRFPSTLSFIMQNYKKIVPASKNKDQTTETEMTPSSKQHIIPVGRNVKSGLSNLIK